MVSQSLDLQELRCIHATPCNQRPKSYTIVVDSRRPRLTTRHCLRKWPSATLDIEPPEALWPETKGQAASLARVRGHPLKGAGGHGQIPGTVGYRRWVSGLKADGRRASIAAGVFADGAGAVQQQRTATSPGNRQPARPPAHRVSWDDGQTPSSAASSGRRGRARCVPDQPVSTGYSRSLADSGICRFTCERASRRGPANVLLSWRSHSRDK